MFKNIFIPFILIILTSGGTIYFWFNNLPLSLFGLIGFFTLGIGSMYISYYSFYNIFPDKRNEPLPPIKHLMSEYQKQKGKKPQTITIGSFLGTIMTIALTAGGIYSWTQLAGKYKAYELKKYGKETTATIVDIGQKGSRVYSEYEYYDSNGKVFIDKFSNKALSIGDTIIILYSTNRPVINDIITY